MCIALSRLLEEAKAHMANIEEKKGEKEGKKAKRKKGTHAHSLAAVELVVSEDSLRDSESNTRE